MKMNSKHFLKLLDFTPEEIQHFLNIADKAREGAINNLDLLTNHVSYLYSSLFNHRFFVAEQTVDLCLTNR